MKPTHILIFALTIISLAVAQDNKEFEDRSIPRLRTPRGPNLVRSQPKQQLLVKTSTTTEAPKQEEEAEYEDEYGEEEAHTTTTTTEAPKKGIRGGVVRPFRSNTDLIEALKRRRAQQQASGSIVGTARPSSPAPSTPTTERLVGGGRAPSANIGNNARSRFSPRGGVKPHVESASSTTTESSAQEQPRKRDYTRGRRF